VYLPVILHSKLHSMQLFRKYLYLLNRNILICSTASRHENCNSIGGGFRNFNTIAASNKENNLVDLICSIECDHQLSIGVDVQAGASSASATIGGGVDDPVHEPGKFALQAGHGRNTPRFWGAIGSG
jgi:hypothetical protein